ncbi:MAG: hypothetical protein JSR63_09050 [Proteobacteria bacterium]|nr:hypothetical protein [Pseudomonadota bacterium]MBS0218316.1 hypothetical protein [Pseudomonadota bacterium]
MEFSLPLIGQAPDLIEIERALTATDPAALLDLSGDGGSLRISTVASDREVIACLHAAGVPAREDELRRLPSVCCGGCGG